MSCGNPHETPCSEVRSLVYVYIDDEIDEVQRVLVTTHLTECEPCVQQFTVERLIKERVRRACGCETVSTEFRAQIVTRIQSVTYRND